ncbi:hypothetical protein PENDEC_c021G04478 [Penicillium decumbens]|uniref:Uncharacterized protein n=1 Tax=Penicillium decumbens TaxID=69771 RepID=A0A1V6P677_PENDC|nr:hypothetical protein PENDEC_c021G04478 [Penicillium decumbens]
MDETTRGRLAQAIRDAFTASSIDHDEDYIDSLISKVDDDVLQAHLANQAHPSNLSVETSSSYHPDSAFTTKAMASILFECFIVNSAISRYGHRTYVGPARTDLNHIRKYTDEVAEYSYEQAISAIHRDNALAMGKGVQNRYCETIFWKIILKGAALIDLASLPSAKGPADGFTMAEKAATKRFMEDAGYRLGAENQRQCRIFWRNLLKMREVGIEKVLYYRTKEFDSYCKGYPKTSKVSLVDTIKKWEAQYRPYIEQLETRILRLGKGDLARVSDLDNPQVTERLKVQESCWNCAGNEWAFPNEEESYKGIGLQTFSPDMVCAPYDNQLVSESGGDKSSFTFLLPKDDSSLLVCSIIPVHEGDFLGVFSGKIRFSETWSPTHGIRGPVDNLWLDYSQVTGTLNQMLVSETGGSTNVRIQWDLIHDDVDTDNCTSWRVSVKATKPIMPFEPLVREAAQQEQYVLHLSPDHAKRGFLELCETD